LPNTYPIGEQDEDAEAKAKRHGKLKILLLENINVDASDFLKKQGYEVGRARGQLNEIRADARSTTKPGLLLRKS
jgi:D-3-phosphoglycerate dehydrogenase